MRKMITISVIFALLFFFQGCEKKFIIPEKTTGTIYFTSDIIPMFDDKCCSCHGTGGDFPVLEESVAYDNIIGNGLVDTANPEASVIYAHIVEVPNIHGGGIFQAEGEMLLLWIKQGAKNN